MQHYGVQKEIVRRSVQDEHGSLGNHSFPRAWDGYVIKGHVDASKLAQVAERTLNAIDSLNYCITPLGLSAPNKDFANAQVSVMSANSEMAAREKVSELLGLYVYEPRNLSKGPRPFFIICTQPGGALVALGADHAFIDGLSLSNITRAVTLSYDTTGIHFGRRNVDDYFASVRHLRKAAKIPHNDMLHYYGMLPQPVYDLNFPNGSAVDLKDWDAASTFTWKVPFRVSSELGRLARRLGVNISALFMHLFQLSCSLNVRGAVPVVYARHGRSRKELIRAIGPFYESVVRPACSDFNCTLTEWLSRSCSAPECPPYDGAWLTDAIEQDKVAGYRGISFNYYGHVRNEKTTTSKWYPMDSSRVTPEKPSSKDLERTDSIIHGTLAHCNSSNYHIIFKYDIRQVPSVFPVINAFDLISRELKSNRPLFEILRIIRRSLRLHSLDAPSD